MKSLKILNISTNRNGGVGTVVKNLCEYFTLANSVILYKRSMAKLSIYKQYQELKNEINLLINKVDVLHFHGSWAPHIFILRKKQKKPVLVSPHGALHKMSLEKSKLKKIIAKYLYVKKTYLNSDCIHALTKYEASDICNFGIRNIPIAIIPNGINFNETLDLDIATDRKIKKLIDNRKVVLSLSRLDPLKGIDLLIESFCNILTHNNDVVLLIVGDGSQIYTNSLNKRIDDLNLHNNIFLLGKLNGIYKNTVYNIADIFILPSYNEGFGLTVLEAYRQRIPVITTTATPFKEILDNKIGWYVEPNSDEITKALLNAISLDSKILKGMGEDGYDFMKEKYSIDIVNKKMERLYKWLINGGQKPDFIINNCDESI
jgi:glycosyltransferase involved in cell wall biosynthesis